MKEIEIEKIYLTLLGVMQEQFRVPGMENLFVEGSECMNRYSEMLAAYERLCERLGIIDEDKDVEIIIDALMTIERKISMKMFEYGMKFALDQK